MNAPKVVVLLFVIACTAFAVPAVAGDSWKETFSGMGSGDSRESGCSGAENMARMNASAACMARRGQRVDEHLGNCSCSSAMEGRVNTCQLSLTVSCEKVGR